MVEGDRHKEIRKLTATTIENNINEARSNLHLLQSHEKGEGKLNLYFSLNERICNNEWMADVDLAVVNTHDSTVHTIVEIKTKDIRPKDIAGIIGAIAVSTKLKNKNNIFNIDGARLIIVFDLQEMIKGVKEKQLTRLQSILKIQGSSIATIEICNECNFNEKFSL